MTTAVLPGLERGSAVLSPCGRYRYELHRERWAAGPRLLAICANPSIATADVNDATCRKLIGFAKRWGYGALSLANLFAFISTDPAGMYAADDPIGPDNDAHILAMAERCMDVFVGWGDIGLYRDRDIAVMKVLAATGKKPMCIGVTRAGSPLHPSRPGYDSPVSLYRGRPA